MENNSNLNIIMDDYDGFNNNTKIIIWNNSYYEYYDEYLLSLPATCLYTSS